jgi:hypothetical protein
MKCAIIINKKSKFILCFRVQFKITIFNLNVNYLYLTYSNIYIILYSIAEINKFFVFIIIII